MTVAAGEQFVGALREVERELLRDEIDKHERLLGPSLWGFGIRSTRLRCSCSSCSRQVFTKEDVLRQSVARMQR